MKVLMYESHIFFYLNFIWQFGVRALCLLQTDDVWLFSVEELHSALLDPGPQAVDVPGADLQVPGLDVLLRLGLEYRVMTQ